MPKETSSRGTSFTSREAGGVLVPPSDVTIAVPWPWTVGEPAMLTKRMPSSAEGGDAEGGEADAQLEGGEPGKTGGMDGVKFLMTV
jgi:hypothetical protein